jgi:TPR repeat protein
MRILLLFTVVISALLCAGAETTNVHKNGKSALVGDLGRKDALIFYSNHTFTARQIIDALDAHFDYHVAAHPAAPLTEYLACLGRKIQQGYQRAGFAKAVVEMHPNKKFTRIHAHITEGPRYRCGEIQFTGKLTNEVVREAIVEALQGIAPVVGTNFSLIQWTRNEPAPYDEISGESLAQQVGATLARLNHFAPKVSLSVALDPGRKVADLVVDVPDAGIKGTIEEIEFAGELRSSHDELLRFLDLKPGVELRADVVGSVSNRLWQSGRFFRHEVLLSPLARPGNFKLQITADELRETPALDQALLPVQQALFNFRNWMVDWEKRPEDFICQVNATSSWVRANVSLVLSSSGVALADHGDSPDGSTDLKYAAMLASDTAALYSPWRKRKFVATGLKRGATTVINISPQPNPSGRYKYSLSTLFGIGNAQGQPFQITVDLPPAAFVVMAEWPARAEIIDGTLVLAETNRNDNSFFHLSVDARTGRLVRFRLHESEFTIDLHPEEGAFQRLVKEIATVSAKHPNDYVTNGALPSFLAFMAADIIEPDNGLLSRFLTETEKAKPKAAQHLRQFINGLTHARRLLLNKDLKGILEPLNRLWTPKPEDPEEGKFSIPISPASVGSYHTVAAFAMVSADALFARGSWPWTLARETTLSLMRQGKYTDAELNRVAASESFGPLGSLAAAFLLNRVDSQAARTFADRGLSRLSAAEFRKDYNILFNTNFLTGQTLNNALGLFRTMSSEEVELLSAGMPSSDAKFLCDLGADLRASPQLSAGEGAWNTFRLHWDKAVRSHLESALKHYAPVPDPTNAAELFERSRRIMYQKGGKPDTAEVFRCVQQAANLGHARAQAALGLFYERGELARQDFAAAMEWYLKASTNKAPHAACRIGDMYFEGKGVSKDLDQAVKWYRIEGEGSCPDSQSKLAGILEQKGETSEALKWFRKAAEGGNVDAQVKLGDLLSDDVFGTPDYVQACVWLGLAAENGHKPSEIRLRRLRTKLTREQRHEFEGKLWSLMVEAMGEPPSR